MKYNGLILLSIVVLLSACASNRQVGGNVIIDTQGVNLEAYRADLAACQSYAEQVSIGEEAAQGAAVGAVVSGAIGAIFAGREGLEKGGAAGGVSGGARGTISAVQEREQVVKTCLRGRGYRVLN